MKTLRRQIQRGFKFRSLAVRSEALDALFSVLRHEDDPGEALNMILDTLKSRVQSNTIVDRDLIAQVVAELSKNEDDLAQECLQVIDAFALPRLRYNITRKQFYAVEQPKSKSDVPTEAKINVYRDRLVLLHQRLMRDVHFAPSVIGTSVTANASRNRVVADHQVERIKLTQLESLVGSTGHKCLYGMISKLEDGNYYLEDLNGKVQMDISNAQQTHGIITEGSIVLAEGELEDGIFRADTLGFPPPETKEDSVAAAGNVDFLLEKPRFSFEVENLKQMEEASTNTSFVVLSEVHLDDERVIEKLQKMFEGYANMTPPPAMFIFLGNFLSMPFGYGNGQMDASGFTKCLDDLAELICNYPVLLTESQFLFVPGPNDPGNAEILPRPPIPKHYTKQFVEKLQAAEDSVKVTFTSNPTRILFYTQTIVVYRKNVVEEIMQQAIVEPNSDHSSSEHLVRTITEQAHLCPYPTQSLLWQYDPALRLYPLPECIIIGDEYEAFQHSYAECGVVNPSSFHKDFNFVMYRPATKESDFSCID